jgi:mRNA interferase MazF
LYNENSRGTLLILAVSSSTQNKLDFELEIRDWEESGLLKPSIFKSALATIEKDYVISKLGSLTQNDVNRVEKLIEAIC